MRSVLKLKTTVSHDEHQQISSNDMFNEDFMTKYVKIEKEKPTIQFKKTVESGVRTMMIFLNLSNILYSIRAILNPIKGSD